MKVNQLMAAKQNIAHSRIETDDIIVNIIWARNGSVAVVPEYLAGSYGSGEFPTFTPIREKMNPRWFHWFTKTRDFWNQCDEKSRGTSGKNRTRPEKFLEILVPLPLLEEQRRIVARIEELAARIEEARELRREIPEHCDRLCRSILSDTSDGAPALTPMRELVKLRELDINVSPDEMYWFAGVYSFGKGLFRGQSKRGTEFSYNRLTRLKTANFVYPKLMAWEGAFAIVPSEYDGLVVSPEFPVFEIDQQRVLPETLEVYFHIPSVWSAVSGASTGTNVRRRRLNPADFLAFEIPLPPMRTQKRLREVKAQLDQINRLQSETSVELDALLPSILDKAFKGEL